MTFVTLCAGLVGQALNLLNPHELRTCHHDLEPVCIKDDDWFGTDPDNPNELTGWLRCSKCGWCSEAQVVDLTGPISKMVWE